MTFTSPTMNHEGSRIDHFLLSDNLDHSISEMKVIDILTDHGHRPLMITLDVDMTMRSTPQMRPLASKAVAWHRVTTDTIASYEENIKSLIAKRDTLLEITTLTCEDMSCRKGEHLQAIDVLCDTVIDLCLKAGEIFPKCKKGNPLAPYWRENVKPFRDGSLFWGKIWNECGRPPSGGVHEAYKSARRAYHAAIKQHKKHQRDLRNSRIAQAMATNNQRDLWSELKKMRTKHHAIPQKVDGVENEADICEIFGKKYESLYNSVPSDADYLDSLRQDVLQDSHMSVSADFSVDADLIMDLVKHLKLEKRDGHRGLWSNHIAYSPPEVFDLLAKMFTMMFIHGYYPLQLSLASIVSIPKENGVTDHKSDKFRGIALSSSINKLFDLVILKKYSKYLQTCDLQFAYKENHSTTLCSLLLKDVAHQYITAGSSVYCSLLDASKAFDRVRLDTLIHLLKKRNMPAPVIRIIVDSFMNQRIRALWQGSVSDEFTCANGLRQGGISSPLLFTVYFDELFKQLEASGAGCYIGHEFMGAFGYADDVTLMAPTLRGLQTLLKVCEDFAAKNDVLFNETKTMNIAFNKKGVVPRYQVSLNGKLIKWQTQVKHLGNVLTCNLSDEQDIKLKKNDFLRRINSVIVHFNSAQRHVCNELFRSNCFFYGSQQWAIYERKPIEQFHVQWRKAVRRLWRLPWQARSGLLHFLIDQPPFISQLCRRFKKLCISIDRSTNAKAQLIKEISIDQDGIIGKNMSYSKHFLNEERKKTTSNTSDFEARANVIRELTLIREGQISLPGFSAYEIDALIEETSTF